jgi:hypothetical protein
MKLFKFRNTAPDSCHSTKSYFFVADSLEEAKLEAEKFQYEHNKDNFNWYKVFLELEEEIVLKKGRVVLY